MQVKLMQKRINWIDIARGIFILAIVMGHVFFYEESKIRWYLYSFHVPAFFFISGYCFRYRDNFRAFLQSRIKRIVAPYLLLSVIYIVLFAIATNLIPSIGTIYQFDFVQSVKTILYSNYNVYPMKYNVALWFLPCLFFVELISYWTERLVQKQKAEQFFRLLICCFSIIMGMFFKTNLPWHIETALAMLIWYNFGIICNRCNAVENIYKRLGYRTLCCLTIVFLLIGMFIPFLNWTNLSVLRNLYGKYHIYYLSCLCNITGYVFLSRLINKCSILEYIGRNTLSILAFHKVPIVFFQYVMPITKRYLTAPDSFLGVMIGIIVWAIAVFTSAFIGEIAGKVFPLLVGKTRGTK